MKHTFLYLACLGFVFTTGGIELSAQSCDPLSGMITTPAPSDILPYASVAASNYHLMNDQGFSFLKGIGIHTVRAEGGWRETEKSAGVYDFTAWDQMKNQAAAAGMRVIWLMTYDNPLYGATKAGPCGGVGADYTDYFNANNYNAITKYANWAAAVVNHFKQAGTTGQIWELWNEPNGCWNINPATYGRLVNTTVSAIKAVDSTAIVITGGLERFSASYMDTYLSANPGAGTADGFGVHWYLYDKSSNDLCAEPEIAFSSNYGYDMLPQTYTVLNNHGQGAKKLWNTEGAYKDSKFPSTYAQLTLRMMATSWVANQKVCTVYDYSDNSYGSGLTAHTATQQVLKTLYDQSLNRIPTGYTIESNSPSNGAINLIRMQGASDIMYLVWVRTGSQSLSVPNSTQAYDMNGNPFTTGTSVSVSLANGPIYLKFTAPFQVSVSSVAATCGTNDGTATAIPSGGSGPFTYTWNTSPAQTSQTAGNLAPGTYTVSISDKNGCLVSQPVSVGKKTCSGSSCASSAPPVIDGQIDAAWSAVNSYSITNTIMGSVVSNADLSAYYKLTWDNAYLYVLAVVKDDSLKNDSGANPWDDDAVEVFIDGNNDKAASYDANDRQFIFRWNDNSVYQYSPQLTNPAGVNFAQSNTTDGYIIEARIAWSAIGSIPSKGKLIGFDLHVDDDDDGGARDAKKTWESLTDQSFSDPALFGVIKLDSSLCGINTGVLSQERLIGTVLYPNPFSSSFHLSISGIELKDTEMKIVDLCGREVKSIFIRNPETTISRESLQSGIYFYRILNDGKKITDGKLIVQ